MEQLERLERVCYGDEDQLQVETFLSLSHQALREMPWNIRLRIWILRLKHKSVHENDAYPNALSAILVELRSQSWNLLLLNGDDRDSLDLMDLPQGDQDSHSSCWQKDSLLKYWHQQQRYAADLRF